MSVRYRVTAAPQARGYSEAGASYKRRALRAFFPNSNSPSSDIHDNADILRQRSRMLYMSAPVATSAINTNRTKIVGTGLTLKATVDRNVLGLSPEKAKEWQSKTEAEFRLWAENRRSCDAMGLNDFYGLQQLALKSWLMSGDVFAVVKIRDPDKLHPYGLRLHLVEADRVSTPDKLGGMLDGLRSFIEGKRGNETEWCDWNIPIHWGGMSDPFQPVEKQIRASYECLKLLAETKYPFVVSTKGRLIADPEYLDLLAQCNCVLQISMVCSKYDRLERGTPSYEERLTILKTVSARVQRTIVRIQPYMPEVFHDVMKNIPRIAEAGAYGVIVEGMKFFKAKPGMTKIGGDFCYPLPRLRHDFEAIKAECHRYGLKFYSGENRLRAMGDSMTCCGIDGLPGFRPNEYNLCMLMNGKNPEPTEKMKEVGTGGPFKTLNQSAGSGRKIAKQSFYGLMQEELAKKTDYHRKVFGLDE